MDKHVSDLDAERLFAGVSVPDPDEALTRFTADVRATFAAQPAEETRAAHLRAMTETWNGLVDTPARPPARSKRRRLVVRGTIVAAGFVLVGGSAMAATGTLPNAAQDAVSRVARVFGVSLPRAHEIGVPTLRTDLDHPDVQVRITEKEQDEDTDRVSGADSDADDEPGGTTNLQPRRPRRSGGGSTSRDDGGSTTPSDPSGGSDPSDEDDNGGVIDDRADPSDGDGDGGGSAPAPGDGDGGQPDPDDDDDDDGGGRGDPKDGTPSGADSSSNDAGSGPAGDRSP